MARNSENVKASLPFTECQRLCGLCSARWKFSHGELSTRPQCDASLALPATASHWEHREKTLFPHPLFIIDTFAKLLADSLVIVKHTNLLAPQWGFHQPIIRLMTEKHPEYEYIPRQHPWMYLITCTRFHGFAW